MKSLDIFAQDMILHRCNWSSASLFHLPKNASEGTCRLCHLNYQKDRSPNSCAIDNDLWLQFDCRIYGSGMSNTIERHGPWDCLP